MSDRSSRSLQFYLINVFTEGSVSTKTSGTRAAAPGSIWRTVAHHSTKARIRQTAICKRFRWQECKQTWEVRFQQNRTNLQSVFIWFHFSWWSFILKLMLQIGAAETLTISWHEFWRRSRHLRMFTLSLWQTYLRDCLGDLTSVNTWQQQNNWINTAK